MPFSVAPRSWDSGRYDEWEYDGKPMVPPQGGGTRKPMPINLTFVPNMAVTVRNQPPVMPTRIPAVQPRMPGVVMPSRIPEVRA